MCADVGSLDNYFKINVDHKDGNKIVRKFNKNNSSKIIILDTDTKLENAYIRVEFLIDFNKTFMGVDLKVYGDYEAGEVVLIPFLNSYALLTADIVKIILKTDEEKLADIIKIKRKI